MLEPSAYTHWPDLHTRPPVQPFPHWPQLLLLVCRSTHSYVYPVPNPAKHCDVPEGHLHALLMQTTFGLRVGVHA